MLDEADQRSLLGLARESIVAGLGQHEPRPLPARPWSRALAAPGAVFTTLTVDGQLRGCRGSLEPRRALAEDVWNNAWASAYDDPRFPPVSAEEIDRLGISISVLTPLEPLPVESEAELLARLQPGVDGLVLAHGPTRATFLPAVWEQLPDPKDFVAQLKHKAGWPGGYWARGLRAFRYRTETFPAHRQ
jgi:AmmeMemoRadiSam system protein A